MQNSIKSSFQKAEQTLKAFYEQPENIARMAEIAMLIADCYRRKGKVIIFGNGGSMCDAMHFAEEFTGRFKKDRPPLPAIAISDPSHITCVGNDYGFDEIFARGVAAYANPGDVVIGISTSGYSPNIIRGLDQAKAMHCSTIALLGKDGGKLKNSCNHQLIVEADGSDRIQEVHTMILHILIERVEYELFFAPEKPTLYA